MRRLGHLRRSLSGQTSGSSVPGSMDSYASTTSEDTSATDPDEDRLKGLTSSPDFSDNDIPVDQQDTPGVRATLRESLRRLKAETDLRNHSRHTHHQDSSRRHVHHIHHLKHHIRRSGDLIRGMDSRGIERTQTGRGMITDSPISADPDEMRNRRLTETDSSDATVKMAALAMDEAKKETEGSPERMSSTDTLDSPSSVYSPSSVESPSPVDSPESVDTPTPVDSPESVETPTPVDSPESVESPMPMDSPEPVDSPTPMDSPELMDSPVLVGSPTESPNQEPVMTESPVDEKPTIMDSPTGL